MEYECKKDGKKIFLVGKIENWTFDSGMHEITLWFRKSERKENIFVKNSEENFSFVCVSESIYLSLYEYFISHFWHMKI